ncbi:MAG: two-component system response regulator PhoP [Candidatus Endobugula sp.]|jgi:two-component system response regulator PhoP
MRLLLVEDEQILRDNLKQFLTRNSYSVDSAEEGHEGLFLGSEHPYDIAIIDIGLPGIDGIELIKELRQHQKNFPILILTARDSWQDKVVGLEAGGDDYLAKPFHNEELLARLNALTRRSKGHASPEIHIGELLINTAKKLAHVNEKNITLTQYEYNTLEYLALNKSRVISKTELTEHLYDQDFDLDSNVIEVLIGRLRKKLDPENTLKPIITHRGQGYRLTEKENKKIDGAESTTNTSLTSQEP